MPAPAAEENPKEITTWKILAKFPKKIAAKDLSYIQSTKKEVHAKKARLHSGHRRTTPGQVEPDITPYPHIHPESQKTVKNIEKKSVSEGRRLSRKLSRTL